MREAAVPNYRLSKSKKSVRVLVTLGLSGLLLGLISATLLTVFKTGITPEDVTTFYAGASAQDGELSELDGMLVRSSARPFQELLEVTHLHLMGGSLMLFLLCHLLSVCDVSENTRIILYALSFTTFLTTFTLPWFIIYLSPLFSYLYGPSIVIFLLSLIFLCLIPVKEMWLNKK